MTPGKFLRLLWPDTGFYCIAHPFKPAGSAVTLYTHKVFSTISEAVTHALESVHQSDTFFAILTLREAKVWDPEKTDHKTGLKGAYTTRKQSNMLASRALFFDLDVGTDAGKYPTQRDALVGLITFLQQTKLPMPTLVSSGGGVHVYWHLDQAVPVEAWRPIAWHMRQLAEGLKLKVDPTRTIDTTSVLRVPGTFNWKDRANPRPVKVLQEGAITPVDAFVRAVNDAMILNGIAATDAPASRAPAAAAPTHGLAAQHFNDFGSPPTVPELAAACGQVREIIRAAGDPAHPSYRSLDNTAWYRGMLGTFKHVEDGDNWCRKLTKMFPRDVADIEAKLVQLEQFPPARCETLQQFMPWKDAPCQGCRFRDKVPNPIAATRKTTQAAPPVVTPLHMATSSQPSSAGSPPPLPASAASSAPSIQTLVAPSATLQALMIPNPPLPYERMKNGGIQLTRTNKDGEDTTTTIYPYDLFPLRRLVNSGEQREQQVWRVTLPRSGAKDFTIDADVLYDQRKFCVALAHNSIYPHKAEIPALQDYMVAYISQLQKTLDADTQSAHLGWSGDFSEFVLPDKVLSRSGTVKTSTLSLAAERAAQFIRKGGDPAGQRKLLEFYKDPAYVANQFVIASSLGSVLFDMTGHHGIVINCSGEPGASKSTTLYTAASLWGDPVMWPLNGTNRGATANARMARIATNANLPTCVDEITHMPVKDVLDLCMGISQPGHRLRLTTDGAERKQDDSYKAAIMISSANSSLHSVMSQDNASGTAGSMRVFEIKFLAQRVHTKVQADEYLRELKQHYGHIGEIFTHFVIQHREAVMKRVHAVMAKVDREARITSGERFWSAAIAVTVVAAEIAQALGLLPYDPQEIYRWATFQQVTYMRGIVREEYRDPLAILTDYIAEKQGNIVVMDRATTIGSNTGGKAVAAETPYALTKPSGALLGHFDIKLGTLLLLKQGFKEHCVRIGANATRILEELSSLRGTETEKVVLDRNVRRTIAAGSDYAKGQAWCFIVNMKHPDIAGVAPVLVHNAAPAAPAAPATGHLQVVK